MIKIILTGFKICVLQSLGSLLFLTGLLVAFGLIIFMPFYLLNTFQYSLAACYILAELIILSFFVGLQEYA